MSGTVYASDNKTVVNDSVARHEEGVKGIIEKVTDYFAKANEPHPEKKLDINFIGGPHYSTEAGFGLGIVGSGLYYSHRDSTGMPSSDTPASNLSLKLDVTTGQLYKLSTEGYHIFKHDKFRITYRGCVYFFKDRFWGIGYDNGIDNANESVYKRFQAQLTADFTYKIGSGIHIGPLASVTYINATRIDKPVLFAGEKPRTVTTGIGMTFYLDTRDFPVNAFNGVYLRVNQVFNPRFLANKYAFSRTEIVFSGYKSIWKGGVLAGLYHADFTYGNTPWGMLPTFGGSKNMRGYYEGRFRDKNEMDFTIELRQHVWRRNGIALWVGAGTIFPRFAEMRLRHVLPNFGIGYRWQFKPRINVRLDLGFGRHEKGINFSINEAF